MPCPTVARAATAEHDRHRARAMVEIARKHRSCFWVARNDLAALVDGLTPARRDELAHRADDCRAANRLAERQRLLEEADRLAAAKREAARCQARWSAGSVSVPTWKLCSSG